MGGARGSPPHRADEGGRVSPPVALGGGEMDGGRGARPAFRQKSAEMAVAACIFLLGAIVNYDSARLGARWGGDGPQAGYFPVFLRPLLCAASGGKLALAL